MTTTTTTPTTQYCRLKLIFGDKIRYEDTKGTISNDVHEVEYSSYKELEIAISHLERMGVCSYIILAVNPINKETKEQAYERIESEIKKIKQSLINANTFIDPAKAKQVELETKLNEAELRDKQTQKELEELKTLVASLSAQKPAINDDTTSKTNKLKV